MIGLDTNVLVRYLMQDDPDQAPLATALIDGLSEDEQGFISVVTLVELHWVLNRGYQLSREECAKTVAMLLNSRDLVVAERDAVRRALRRIDGPLDFSDALIAEFGWEAGCTHTATFDRRAARLPGMRLVAAGKE